MLLFLLPLLFTDSYSLKTVTTSYGKVRGITDYTGGSNHKYSFKSVPFAKPPVGDLRFALPQKPDSWDGVLDGSKYSAACLSNSSLTSTPQKFISEDCLYINIFTSENCLINKCPVIVYYHGGSFSLDSATMFSDRFIFERYVENGIVFVIPAYRLGVFGQFYLGDGDIVPTNLIVHDAIEALHYVHQEISNFGGDKNDVTLMGHSSGAQLVNALGFSHYVDPEQKLFQKFIVLSAHELYGFPEFKIANSFEVAKLVNCFSENKKEVVNCLRGKNALDILQAQKSMEEEEHHLFRSLIQAPPLMDFGEKLAEVKKNAPKGRKMLCGVTEHEFEKFRYTYFRIQGRFLDFENPVEVIMTYHDNFANRTRNMLNSDSSSVIVSAATYSKALINAGGEVYLFETRQKPYSMHVSDMQYIIGIHREKTHTKDMDILDSFYSKMLVNFTKYGEPSPMWEKLDPGRMNFLALEVDEEHGIWPKMEDGFHEELINFWLTDMMELDSNITEQKRENGKLVNITLSNFTTQKPINWTTQNWNIITFPNLNNITTPLPENLSTQFHSNTTSNESTFTTTHSSFEPFTPESFPIYNQWWFYGILVFIVIIVSIVILMILNKSRSEESRPLLA
ncbi:hypothetical protein CRE_16736 [Caenorhabditis remanei]|uniref:Carboxylic ester hydrolase n=1 Tax=Caenorhabditis remanei TaxID=31234 RepID=E3MAQ7_CAERE|nr:hypothetical protein CRE_16736 [Caenorhabditis remanei]